MNNNYENLQDIDLIKLVKEQQCSEALKEIVKRHEKLYHNIYNYYSRILEKKSIDSSNIIDEKIYNFYEIINSFEEGKNTKFSTWVGNAVKYKCLKLINKKPDLLSINIDNDFFHDIPIEDSIEPNESISDKIYKILENTDDKRILEIFKLRFCDKIKKERSWKSISEIVGVSTQTAINLFERGKKILNKEKNRQEILDEIEK